MTTLAELDTDDKIEVFSRQIADGVIKRLGSGTSVNEGIRTSQELTNRIKSGSDVDFNYKRLLKESEEY